EETRQLRYANCGHLPAILLRRDGSLEKLGATATVLGLFTDWDCEIGEKKLSSGDMLALYTDGVTESFNEAHEEFGEERIIELIQRSAGHSPQDCVTAMVEEVRRHNPREQQDDITLIVAKCR